MVIIHDLYYVLLWLYVHSWYWLHKSILALCWSCRTLNRYFPFVQTKGTERSDSQTPKSAQEEDKKAFYHQCAESSAVWNKGRYFGTVYNCVITKMLRQCTVVLYSELLWSLKTDEKSSSLKNSTFCRVTAWHRMILEVFNCDMHVCSYKLALWFEYEILMKGSVFANRIPQQNLFLE